MSNFRKAGIGITVTKNSEIMLVDVCLSFCKANRKAARHVKDIVEKYCKIYGQLVSFYKSLDQF